MLEEIGSCREGNWVGNLRFEVVRLCCEEIERLEDSGGGSLGEEENEGFDGCYRHGEIWILSQQSVVGFDNANFMSQHAPQNITRYGPTQMNCRSFAARSQRSPFCAVLEDVR